MPQWFTTGTDLKPTAHQTRVTSLGSEYARKERKEGNVLFNDTLNTFYIRLYDVGHMAKDHSDSDKGNPLPPLNGLLFPISSKGSFNASSHRQNSTYHGFVTPIGEHWLEREIAQ